MGRQDNKNSKEKEGRKEGRKEGKKGGREEGKGIINTKFRTMFTFKLGGKRWVRVRIRIIMIISFTFDTYLQLAQFWPVRHEWKEVSQGPYGKTFPSF